MRSLPLALGCGVLGLGLSLGLGGCTHKQDYVDVKDVALGRVVVYRNGVAYYERRAEVEGDELRLGWQVTYKKEGLKPFVLRGRSTARYRDGKIAYLCDAYEPSVEGELAAWQRETGVPVDVSYT